MLGKEVSVNLNILFFAFRYALGRQTTAPGIVQDEIIKNIDNIDDFSIIQMLDEIITERSFTNRTLQEWIGFEKKLIKEVQKREDDGSVNEL